MGLAGLINLAMLAMAAAVFFTRGDTSAGEDLGAVVAGLDDFVGDHAGTLFGVALLVSGIASSCVGTMSGQVVMEGFLHRRIPVFLRRAITMIPALILLAVGFNPTRALVLSQVFLSFGIPFALIPLVAFTAKRSVMGALANRRLTNIAAIAVTARHRRAQHLPAGHVLSRLNQDHPETTSCFTQVRHAVILRAGIPRCRATDVDVLRYGCFESCVQD